MDNHRKPRNPHAPPPPAQGVIINPWDTGSSVDPPGYPSGPGGDHDPSEVHYGFKLFDAFNPDSIYFLFEN